MTVIKRYDGNVSHHAEGGYVSIEEHTKFIEGRDREIEQMLASILYARKIMMTHKFRSSGKTIFTLRQVNNMKDIIYQYQQGYVPDNGNAFYFWVDCSKEAYEEELAEGGIARILYAAAQPSALPLEVTYLDGPYVVINGEYNKCWAAGANWMRERAKALGCKSIKLPEKIYTDHITTGKASPALCYQATVEALKAQGFTVEGE